MKVILVLLFSTFALLAAQKQDTPIQVILKEIEEELKEWVGYSQDILTVAQQCNIHTNQQSILQLHTHLAQVGPDFSKKHIELIISTLKKDASLKQFFGCMIQKRNTENDFFKEKKKYKLLNEFIQKNPDYAAEIFYEEDKPVDKGYRLGRFFRAFFQYVYFYVQNPSETSSTTLLRTITISSDVFGHEDVSPCVALQTSGTISDSLDDLSIQNIYIKIPAAFEALKYIKWKPKCKNEKYLKYARELSQRIGKVDAFKVMYHEYAPYVEIAAEKYGNKQIQRIGKLFANIINNPKPYTKLSQEQLL